MPLNETTENYLPKLRPGLIPRVAAMHGLVGYGNCSLSVPMAVVAAGGIEVCPLPSSVLSAHTAFRHFSFLDTTPNLPGFLESWRKIGVKPDGLYSGFLGSAEQIDLLKQFCAQYPDCFRVIDPVMGDNGKRYATYTDALCARMRELASLADILAPNLTEASILTGRPYHGQAVDAAEGEALCRLLLDMGTRYVVLKGMQRGDYISNAVMGQDLPYTEIRNDLYPKSLYGTGDLFASVLTAGVFSGHGLVETVDFASRLVYDAIVLSMRQPGHELRGVSFEPLLGRVADFCRREDLLP